MKSKKLMGIFALASCVMLAGCGGGQDEPKPHEHSFPDTWSTSETQHWHQCECGEKSGLANHVDSNNDHKCDVCGYDLPIPAPKIELKELPELSVEGETIELKDYVKTVDGGAFDLNFDDESFSLIDIDGTKITFLAEGEVSFEASYKGEKVNGTFNVIGLTRAKFLEWTTDVGYNYELWCDVYEGDTPVGIERDSVHNDEYVHMTYFGYDEELDETYPGGIAHIDGHYYFYTTDVDETEAVADPGYASSSTFETYNCPLELNDQIFDTINLKKKLGINVDALVLKDDENKASFAFDLCAGIAGVTQAKNSRGDVYEPSDVAFFFDTLVDETGAEQECMFFVPFVAIPDDPSSEGYYDIYYISTEAHPLFEEDTPHVECVEKMIENKEKPAPYDFSAVTSKLNSFVDSENYTASLDYGWFDGNGDPLDPKDYPDMDGLVFQDCADSMVAGSETTAVSNEAAAMYKGTAPSYEESRGFLLDDGTVYNYALFAGAGYQAVETDYASISNVGDERFAFLSTSAGENELFPEDLVYNYDEEAKAYLMNVDAQNKLLSKVFKSSSTLSNIVTKVLDPYLIDYERDIYSFFEGSFVLDENSAKVAWDLVWDSDTIFNVTLTLENQGTTVVPSDIVDAVKAAIGD